MIGRLIIVLFLFIMLILLAIGCFIILLLPPEPQIEPLRSNFVPHRESLQVGACSLIDLQNDRCKPFMLPIESYHISKDGHKLSTLKIYVNGQPLTLDQLNRQTAVFSITLATVQVLSRGQPTQTNMTGLEFPSAACQNMLKKGEPVLTGTLALKFPSSTWSVCHIWIGHIPGTYDLSMEVTDEDNSTGKRIVQRIEVK